MPESAPLDDGRMALVTVSDGPAKDWLAVYRDTNDNRLWVLDAAHDLHPVTRDAVGNWVAVRGEARVYARDGTIFYPADDPIPDSELELAVVKVAAGRLEAGATFTLEDEARLHLARRRLGVAA